MPCTIAHVLVALDGSARDREVADVAGRLATTTGVSLAVVLSRTAQVTARLGPFAASEDLAPADAAEAYADHIAEPLRRRGIPTSAAAVLADDAVAAIAAYADRHHSAMILTAGGTRRLRRTVAERLARISPTPLVVVPTQFDRSAVEVA
ncbi:MAG TPA: universal stress protein [Euzebyales bacterium]|nr:universal stress protein [Euzebyales bacterium]